MDETQITKLREDMGGCELIETHISWLLLKGDLIYKIKKPVKFSFLDFSTLEKREFFCEEEVRLNRRLSPGIYLGIVPVVERAGKLVLEGLGKIIEYAVKMKRLPQGQRMDILLLHGKVTEGHIEKIARIVAEFHKSIDVIADKRFGSAHIVKEQIDDLANHRETIERACGLGEEVGLILARSDRFIWNNRALFKQRQDQGMIRDCHGDWYSANIFIVDDQPVIFDCIEFSENFRFIDVASEVAFMAMDLEAFGREDLAKLFVNEYLSKTQDAELETVLNLYKCYRANVRAKIAAIDYSQHTRKEAKDRIRKYVLLAERYALSLS